MGSTLAAKRFLEKQNNQNDVIIPCALRWPGAHTMFEPDFDGPAHDSQPLDKTIESSGSADSCTHRFVALDLIRWNGRQRLNPIEV